MNKQNRLVNVFTVGVGLALGCFLFRKLWHRILANTNQLSVNQVSLLQKINNARLESTSIVYLTIDETVRIRGKHYDMDFNLMTRIEKKEQNKFHESKNPFLPPFQPGLHICELGESHRLLFNKYSIFKNHVLLVTKDFESQESRLNQSDFKQLVLVQGALNGIYYFNSGQESGASQKHKHLQILPVQSKRLPFIELIEQWIETQPFTDEILLQPQFGFVHGIKRLPESKDEKILVKAFTDTYNQLFESLVKTELLSYNLIGTQRFMLIVPRKAQKINDTVSVNSVGLAGSLLFKNKMQFEQYQQIEPADMLKQLTFQSLEQVDQAIAQLQNDASVQ